MPIGAPIGIQLYYRDGSNAIVPIAMTEFLNENTGSPTELLDVTALLPTVLPTDAWAGENIGIRILSTVELQEVNLQGGTWGIDNVRLTAIPEPASVGLLLLAGGLALRRGRRVSA